MTARGPIGEAPRRQERQEWSVWDGQVEILDRAFGLLTLKDEATARHSERTAALAALLADRSGLGADRAREIRLAARLHDIGKLAIPDSILRKPGPLSLAQESIMRHHAQIGHDLFAGTGLPSLDLVAAVALTHHERVDGCGYPNGLKGSEIPISGRIVAIADSFDCLVSDRPYRRMVDPQVALDLLQEGSGTRFDPDLLTVFRQSMDTLAEPSRFGGAGTNGSAPAR